MKAPNLLKFFLKHINCRERIEIAIINDFDPESVPQKGEGVGPDQHQGPAPANLWQL